MENQEKKPSKILAILWGLLVMLIYLIIMSLAQLGALIPIVVDTLNEVTATGNMDNYMQIYTENISKNSESLTIWTFIGTLIAVIVMVLWYYFRIYKKSVSLGTYESVAPKLKNGKSILFLVLGAIACYSVDILIYDMVYLIMPNFTEVFEEVLGSVLGGFSILGFVTSWILAPIGEELTLRGVAMHRAKQSFGLVGCMVYSGILFGVFHMNPLQGLYAIPLGMFLGYVAYKYKSVIPCIIVHAVNNVFAGFSTFLGYDTLYVPIIGLVIFGGITIFLAKKIDFFKENQVISDPE